MLKWQAQTRIRPSRDTNNNRNFAFVYGTHSKSDFLWTLLALLEPKFHGNLKYVVNLANWWHFRDSFREATRKCQLMEELEKKSKSYYLLTLLALLEAKFHSDLKYVVNLAIRWRFRDSSEKLRVNVSWWRNWTKIQKVIIYFRYWHCWKRNFMLISNMWSILLFGDV